MTYKKLTDDLSVAPQITASDLAELAAAGFKSIIANRPDGEGADQPSFVEIESATRQNGLSARYLPVMSGKVTDADAVAFASAMSGLPKPQSQPQPRPKAMS